MVRCKEEDKHEKWTKIQGCSLTTNPFWNVYGQIRMMVKRIKLLTNFIGKLSIGSSAGG